MWVHLEGILEPFFPGGAALEGELQDTSMNTDSESAPRGSGLARRQILSFLAFFILSSMVYLNFLTRKSGR
jgi:hypothetical protein